MTRRGGDVGSGSILVLTLAVVIGLLGALAASVAAVAVARHRAASAADLAALAAADRAPDGALAACASAARAARAVAAVVDSCRLHGAIADVVVAVHPAGPLGALGTARARARAGPDERRLSSEPSVQPGRRG